MNQRPPNRALKFLRWYCKEEFLEEIEGDLLELFELDCELSPNKAEKRFWWNVIAHFRPDYIKSIKPNYTTSEMGKLNNYLKVGWRNLRKYKVFSGVKIGGLSLGIASCLLIFFYINQELSYDNFYDRNESIYRVTFYSKFGGYETRAAHFPSPFAEALTEEFSEIEQSGRLNTGRNFGAGSNQVRKADNLESIYENRVVLADQSILNILELTFIKGSPNDALSQPNSIVITQSTAQKYFPDEDPIGEVLIFNNEDDESYQITGVIDDYVNNTHFQYDFIKSLSDKEFFEGESTSWRNQNYSTYILLKEGTDVTELESKMSRMLDKYFLPALDGPENSENRDWVSSFEFRLQPVNDIYLNRYQIQDGLAHGDVRYILLFGSIGFFILLIAIINFVNLSTARSSNRGKEIGLRKTIGSNKNEIIKQFLVESSLLSTIAVVISVVIVSYLLPVINNSLELSINLPWNNIWFIPGLVLGSFIIGFLSGIYPAFILASFTPLKAIHSVRNNSKKIRLRSGLVVFQFSVTCIMLVGTIIVNQQMDYLVNKDIGYEKDNIMILEGTHTMRERLPVLKEELLRIKSIENVSITGFIPVDGFNKNNGNWLRKDVNQSIDVSGQQWAVDHDYIETFGLRIKEGRNFNQDLASDSQSVIINETLAERLFLEEVIGSEISNHMGTWTIIGVVEDFNYENMKGEIRPLGMFLGRSIRAVSIKLNNEHAEGGIAIAEITNIWNELIPEQEIQYSYLDTRFENMYRDVSHMKLLFSLFSILAISIASLGLFALSSYSNEQRKKEISIRLILGATFGNIIRLLTQYYLKLVVIALLISFPVSWYLMQEWLSEFTYRISFNWEFFTIAAAIALIITVTTTTYQAIRATFTNPVESLKES